MLKEEFEKLMGEPVSQEEYIEANAMYMYVDDFDKETFVRQYKRVRGLPLLRSIIDKASSCERKNSKLLEKINDAVNLFLDIENDDNLDQNWEKYIEEMVETMVGRKKVTIKKCQKGYTLSTEQLSYILQNLK
jgi:hypothetical protein